MCDLFLISDNAGQGLQEVPRDVLEMTNLKMLYLEGNEIEFLPKNFFLLLRHLTWLDLRNNHLKEIPKNIAYHENLETLLLSRNKLERLPNELSLLPKLKVLQISDNPLEYPERQIIKQGMKKVIEFLRGEYEKENGPISTTDIPPKKKSSPKLKLDKNIKPQALYDNILYRNDSIESVPAITVKQLMKSNVDEFIHKITRNESKISLSSICSIENDQSGGKLKDRLSIDKETLKNEWINKLKLLVNEQEKILQQERNVRALNTWRNAKKLENPRTNLDEPLPTPFGTYAEYGRMLSREDLRRGPRPIESVEMKDEVDVPKLIEEVVAQLREIETLYNVKQSPRQEIEEAGQQIQKIMDLHKKLRFIKIANNTYL